MTTPPIATRACFVVAFAMALLVASTTARAREVEEIDLYPPERAMWTGRNVVAGVTSVFGMYRYWYQAHRVRIETVPPEAEIGLYYLRSNFQKRFERVSGPVDVKLPSRIQSTHADRFRIRVAADGYLVKEERFSVHDLPERIVVALEPLPNALTFVGQTHLGQRTTLTLRTTEEPQVRVGKPSGGGGFTVTLVETANRLEEEPDISSGHISDFEVQQIGEDLLMRIGTTSPDVEVRSRMSRDPVRQEHVLAFDLLPKGAHMLSPQDVARELARVDYAPGDRCGARFEQVLRDRLDRRVVARAFRGAGAVPEFYQKEAMRKLGRFDRGRVHTSMGDVFRIGSPIELELAMQSAFDVRDYFAVLGAIARRQPEPATFLRSILAPSLPQLQFDAIYAQADDAFRSCR